MLTIAQHSLRPITQATTDEEMKQRTVTLGEKIWAEDGVARAVELVCRYVER